jgi:integrase
MDEYLKQKRKRFNRSLRKLAEKLELPESQKDISIYTARHSFAMWMLNKNKQPVEMISQALGHQSVETTKHYLAKFSTTKMAEATDINLLDD